MIYLCIFITVVSTTGKKEHKMKENMIILMLSIALIFINTPTSHAASPDVTDSWSGTITHYSLGTGTTQTEYYLYIDIDVNKENSNTRKITHSEHRTGYNSPRFMDPNISFTYETTFVYRNNTALGNTLQTIYPWSWNGSVKYPYILPGGSWKNRAGAKSGGPSTTTGFHLTASFTIGCKINTGSFVCGTKSFTKSFRD